MIENRMLQQTTAVLLLCLIIPLLNGCVEGEAVIDQKAVSSSIAIPRQEGMPVSEILADPAKYQDREVTVFGKVSAGLAFEFVGEQPYLLEHGKSGLWVITSEMAPQEGIWLTVQGVVKVPYQVKGRHYSVAVVEKKRRQ